MNKKELELILSQVAEFDDPKVKLEQYATDATIAADCLWNAFSDKNIKSKVIADLGAGPGIFGLGALILGAKKVYFVEIDKNAIKLAKQNLKKVESIVGKKLNTEFFNMDIKEFTKKVDVVIQNPPFGTREKHDDKLFLESAFAIAPVVYSFHKTTSKSFISALSKDYCYSSKLIHEFEFPIRATMKFHKKKVEKIDVGCWKFVKI